MKTKEPLHLITDLWLESAGQNARRRAALHDRFHRRLFLILSALVFALFAYLHTLL